VAHQTVNTIIPNKFQSEKGAVHRVRTLSTMLVQMNKDKDSIMNEIIDTDCDDSMIDNLNDKYDRLYDDIQYNLSLQEELKAFIAVGYPACLTTNASSVEEEYKRKMVIYNAKESGISISDDHVIMDEDDPLGVMNM
jgi:hypothetical protein